MEYFAMAFLIPGQKSFQRPPEALWFLHRYNLLLICTESRLFLLLLKNFNLEVFGGTVFDLNNAPGTAI